MPTQTIIEFILYITPGFLAIEIYRAFYPGKNISQFSQITWSVIYGVVIYIGVRWLDVYFLKQYLNSNSREFPNVFFILGLFFTGILVGGLRSLAHFIRIKIGVMNKSFNWLLPDPQSIWAKINQPSNKDWAVVFLDDGVIYLGYIAEYTFDPNADNQDFLLSRARRVDERLKGIYLISGRGVYLNTRNVKRIEFVKGSKGP